MSTGQKLCRRDNCLCRRDKFYVAGIKSYVAGDSWDIQKFEDITWDIIKTIDLQNLGLIGLNLSGTSQTYWYASPPHPPPSQLDTVGRNSVPHQTP